MALRPAVNELEPPARLSLLANTFRKFFPWVWMAIVILLISGYGMVFAYFGGFAGSGLHIHIMQGLGIIMMLLFFHLYFAPYRRLRKLVAGKDWPAAAAQLSQIRVIIGINLVLGLIVVLVGSGGRYLLNQ